MKELSTTYKILLLLTGIILVNIFLFVFKSNIGGDSIYNGTVSLQKYILKNYNHFYIFNNGTAYNRSRTAEILGLSNITQSVSYAYFT